MGASLTSAATHAKVANLAGTVTQVGTTAAVLLGVQVYNGSGAAAYIQVFDAVPGNVTLGTTVPDKQFEVANGAIVSLNLPSIGSAFVNGISLASTTAANGSTGSSNGVYAYADYA
jgi:hypothetical protein